SRFDQTTLPVTNWRIHTSVWLRHCVCRTSQYGHDQSRNVSQGQLSSVKIALALATGVVDVDHLQLRVEVERGRTLFPIPDAGAFRAAKRNMRFAAGCGGIDVRHACFDFVDET